MRERQVVLTVMWCFCFVGFLTVLLKSARAEAISVGDRVVVVADDAPVKDAARTATTLLSGTTFTVGEISGSYALIREQIGSEKVRGWVLQRQLLKIGHQQRVIAAKSGTCRWNFGATHLLGNQIPLTVKYQSNHPTDLLVMGWERIESYKKMGQLSAISRMVLNTRQSEFRVLPSDDVMHVVIDNSQRPPGGANSRREINYRLAILMDLPAPKDPMPDKGIIIGKATVEFEKDGQVPKGTHEWCQVEIEVYDGNTMVKKLMAPLDEHGYFFLENVSTRYAYRVGKMDIQHGSLSSSTTLMIRHGFTDAALDGVDREGKPYNVVKEIRGPMSMAKENGVTKVRLKARGISSVLDLGWYIKTVDENGKGDTTITLPIASSFRFGPPRESKRDRKLLPSNDVDRHEWFLTKYPESPWCDKVKADRDNILACIVEARKKN